MPIGPLLRFLHFCVCAVGVLTAQPEYRDLIGDPIPWWDVVFQERFGFGVCGIGLYDPRERYAGWLWLAGDPPEMIGLGHLGPPDTPD
jgi:hypothetical protein